MFLVLDRSNKSVSTLNSSNKVFKRRETYAELFVFFVIVEVGKEEEKLLLVPSENSLDCWRFLGVRNEHLGDANR